MDITIYGTLNSHETGPSRVTRGMSKSLSDLGYEVTIITHGDIQKCDVGADHVWLGESPGHVRGFIDYGERASEHMECDIFHTLESYVPDPDIMTVQWTFTTLEMFLRDKILPNPRDFIGDMVLNITGRRNMNSSPITIATSPETFRQVKLYWRKTPSDIIPLGIEDNYFGADMDSDRMNVLFVGRISRKKNQQSVLRHLDANSDEYSITIAGEISNERYLPEEWKDNVLGFVERNHLMNLYQRADVVVVPSLHENFSMVALEAIANDNILVISDTCGFAMFGDVRANGGVHIFGSGMEMARYIEKLSNVSTPSIRRKKKKSRRLAEKYRWSNVVEEYIELYDEIV